MKYHMDDAPVLKNLNVSIEPGWKVGVVGRIGAGKSSLISALFRLFNEGLEGEIKIDGRDTSTIKIDDRDNLSELRCKISIILQEPVLFSESLRYNLNLFNQYDDLKLWEVLRQVELNDVTLDHDIFSGGHNFSVGPQPILIRSESLRFFRIVFNINIICTDALIQDTIRSNFKECTVITIAHRLNTIIDSNRIIVMENGSIIEFGCPYELLHDKPNGYFSQMVEKTGNQMLIKKISKLTIPAEAFPLSLDVILLFNIPTDLIVLCKRYVDDIVLAIANAHIDEILIKFNSYHSRLQFTEIATKRAVISVCTTDNACFAWSVVAALYPAEKYTDRESSYPSKKKTTTRKKTTKKRILPTAKRGDALPFLPMLGRPILVRTPEMIEKVRDFVANDRNASLKMMEEALNISKETIRTILHEDLGKTKVCAKFVPHTLRSDIKSARINYSRDIVAAAENNPSLLNRNKCIEARGEYFE
ncbi:L259 protein, partial [Pseudoatta argentina]